MDALAPAMAADAADHPSGSLLLRLDGFEGPLDMLLAAARAHEIDLALLSLPMLLDQLLAGLQAAVAIERKADWVSIAAWLVLLRSRLLLPSERPEQQAAAAKAGELQSRLRDLQEVQASAAWLDARPQLGRDVFPRGCPELPGRPEEDGWQLDIIEFLWAGMALFEEPSERGTAEPVYAPPRSDLHTVDDARARILHRLGEAAVPLSLAALLPDAEPADERPNRLVRERSRWTSTLIAGLELAKQQLVQVEQACLCEAIPVLQLTDAATRDRTV